MKLTTASLRDLVREVLSEQEDKDKDKDDGDVFPPPPDEETVEDAEESLDHDQDIIRFYENIDEESLSAVVHEEILKALKK
jgi:hypothetical protein